MVFARWMMSFDWNDVHHFITVVEKETLTAAAEALDVQHSTVSRRIAHLEACLGVRLFDRIGKRYLLTGEGQRLYAQAAEIAKNIRVLQHMAHEEAQAVAEVAISAPPVVLQTLLPAHLPAFYAEYDSIRLILQSNVQLSNLHERQADIALRLVRPEAHDLVVRRLRDLSFGFYAHPAYLRACAPHERRFLGLSTRNPLADWAQAVMGARPLVMACNDFGLIRQAALARLGVGFLPADCVRGEALLQAVAVDGDVPEVLVQPLFLVMHEDVRRSPAVRAVADFLCRVLAG